MLPKAKNIVNTVVFGFRHAKIIGICSVFCSRGFKNTRKHRLNDDLGVDKNATISSVATCNNKKEKQKKKKQEQEQEQKQKKNMRKNATRRCVVGCLQAAV